jgi:hypothetical protein
LVSHRPAHEVTVALMFRASTLEPDLMPSVVAALGVAGPSGELGS